MSTTPGRALDRIAAAGLLVGAIFGLAGTLVRSPDLQAILWAIDSVGLVIAASLLALKYFRAGADIVAGGFLVFAGSDAGLALCRTGGRRGPGNAQRSHEDDGDRSSAHEPEASPKARTRPLQSLTTSSRCP